jgi:ATP-dependent Clp protease ATP-binding subunit ClpA
MVRFSDGVLTRLTRDLTAEARQGLLEPVRCRADEIARVMDILLRHGKNNPVLVGPAGVGKTAIAEGLAQRIAAGNAPLSLRDIKVLALDHVSLLAGTTYRGQYEERIRELVAEATASPDVVLFVDELHNLIGQGTAMGAAMDAANMLKPALVRGDFRVIGATTDDEYERWVCGDPALERRFQKVAVRELGVDETLEILRARKDRLERHHNVVITDEALVASVRLTDEFVTDRHRPDRAIDALDEACAHAHALAGYSPRAEALIRERRDAVRLARSKQPAAAKETATAAAAEPDESELYVDPLDDLARSGFAALERFGAEIEAAFGMPGGVSPRGTMGGEREARAESAPSAPARPASPAGTQPPSARLAELDAELERQLIEEGVVVRPHDIARVVGVATGRSVKWEE